MTALAWLRPGEESLETNLLERENIFHCERFLEDWREEE
jgi:predicted metal-dependent HD superfamily phosphohydrolase